MRLLRRISMMVLMGLLSGRGQAEDAALRILELMDSGRLAEAQAQWDVADLTGAGLEVVQARAALDQENYREAMRHLARVQVLYYRETEWIPAALFYEVLIEVRMGTFGTAKKVSAFDELKTVYPQSRWCRRAEEEVNRMVKEEGVLNE